MKSRRNLEWLIPLLILLAATAAFRVTDIDLSLERLFYRSPGGWVFKDLEPWRFLYRFGYYPAWIIVVGGVVALAVSKQLRRTDGYGRSVVYFLLVMVVGPGLIVNTALKQHWGRPRPREIVEFDGTRQHLEVWEKGITGEGNSFPSGHAAMAFYLFTPFFPLRKTRRGWASFFLVLGIVYGCFMGAARMVQGAHFLSDVTWSAGIVYFTALAFHCLVYRREHQNIEKDLKQPGDDADRK